MHFASVLTGAVFIFPGEIMTLINLAILGLLIFAAYRFIRLFIDACAAGWRQAELLEKEYGFDVLAAARHQMGLAKCDQPVSHRRINDSLGGDASRER
jgi:hypothetical protein